MSQAPPAKPGACNMLTIHRTTQSGIEPMPTRQKICAEHLTFSQYELTFAPIAVLPLGMPSFHFICLSVLQP